jgi:hypothetical protein
MKDAVRRLTNRAVKQGKILKSPCEVCGTDVDIQAHHDDYSKPLDVRWLCRKHHQEHHKTNDSEDKIMSVDNNQTSKAFPYQSFIPFYFNGLKISNHATVPNTRLTLGAGSCLDSTGTFQMSSAAAINIDATTVGLNGIDTGVLVLSTVYAVYLVSDPVTQQATGAMISTSLTGPLMPFGYSAWALVGFIVTDASVHFLAGYWSDNDAPRRVFLFDAPQATAITAGAATTYATGVITLTKWIPAINNVLTILNTSFNPAAASRTVDFQGGTSTGDQVIITGQVASVLITNQIQLLSQLVTGVPTSSYKVSNADSNVAVNVAGYYFDL